MAEKRIDVHPYPGYRGEESPRKFELDGETVEVVETIEKWVEAEESGANKKRYFKVKGDDKRFYTLFFDEKKNDWFYEG